MHHRPDDPPALKNLIGKAQFLRLSPLAGNVSPMLDALVEVLRDLYRRTSKTDP